MRHVLVLVLSLLITSAAAAQGPCDTTLEMPCGVFNVNFGIGTGGWNAPATVCGEPWFSCSASIFEVTLTTTSTLSANISFPGGFGMPHMYLLGDCAGVECIADTPVTGDMSWGNCLLPGTYYVVINEPTCLFYTFNFDVTCEPCSDPVDAEAGMVWGTLKTLYR